MFIERFRQKKGLKLNIKFTILIVSCILPPVIIFCVLYFKNLEKQEINRSAKEMEYTLSSYKEQVVTVIESAEMTKQFVLNDTNLKDYLVKAKREVDITGEEDLRFYNTNISALERMVEINPYVYNIHVYSESNNVQEMLPILYKAERMTRNYWYYDEVLEGWHFGHDKTIQDSSGQNSTAHDASVEEGLEENVLMNSGLVENEFEQDVLSYIAVIENSDYGKTATVEVSVLMERMFPWIYDGGTYMWSCFVDRNGNTYYNKQSDYKNEKEQSVYLKIFDSRMESVQKNVEYIDTEKVIPTQINGNTVIMGYLPIQQLDGYVVVFDDISADISKIYESRNFFFLIAGLIMLLLIILVDNIVKSILKQLYHIFGKLKEVQKGNLDVIIENCGNDEVGELGRQINKMLSHIRQLMDDNLNRELLVKNSEIRSLQNQINAHFIYNVLESIKMMAEIDEEYEISNAITSLGRLLRYSMKWTSGVVNVEEEITYIKNYLALINLRFDYEIYLSLNIAPELYKQAIPKMSLQPIVENAIYHGIEQMAEDTNIYVKGFVEGDECIIEITDAGKGMSEAEVENLYKRISGQIETSGGSGNGIGLKNVQDRIKMCFGEVYGLEISSKQGCYTKVSVRMPRIDGRSFNIK